MNKIFTLLVLAVAAMSASAQCYLGGSFGFVRDATENRSDFTIAPEIGYSINDKWSVGGTIQYDYTYYQGATVNLFGLNPYARYTFCRVADDKLGFFVDGGFGFGVGSYKAGKGWNSESISTYNVGFKPGISYSFNKHCSVVAHIGFFGYQGGNDEAKQFGYNDKFSFDFSSMNLNFGFYYSF